MACEPSRCPQVDDDYQMDEHEKVVELCDSFAARIKLAQTRAEWYVIQHTQI